MPIRLVLGAGFLLHGIPKLFSPEGHADFVSMLTTVGVGAPQLMSWFIGAIEFIGALCLLAGIYVRLSSFFLMIEMGFAALLVHRPFGFLFLNIQGVSAQGPIFGMPGYEVNLLYIASLFSLLISGAGAFSLSARHRMRAAG